MEYSRVDSRNLAERRGSVCSHCGNSGRVLSEDHKQKIANANTGRVLSDEIKERISQSNKGKVRNDDVRKRISEAHIGKKLSEETKLKIGIAARNMSEETRQKISDKLTGVSKSKEHISKVSESNRGKTRSDASKLKMSIARRKRKTKDSTRIKMSESQKNISDEVRRNKRLAAIRRIQNSIENGGQMFPNYNKSAIPIIEEKARELGITDLQHAENGGEFYIEELGYWVDGYSKEKNIVIEYYEPHHNRLGERDKIREREITDFLKCKLIIIK
jgi:hypothetical protein